MAFTTINNGDVPDATILMANFNFLASGAGIKTGSTMEALKTFAALTPTQPFSCIPTDIKAWMLYTGVATAGPDADGWVTIVSWETIS